MEEYKSFLKLNPEVVEEYKLNDKSRTYLDIVFEGPFFFGESKDVVYSDFKRNFGIDDFPEHLICGPRALRHTAANKAKEEAEAEKLAANGGKKEEEKTPAVKG